MKNLTLLISLICFNSVIAQNIIDFPSITTQASNAEPIELKRLKISVFVIENIATTTFEMQFYNNNNRVMEGELNFPLGDGVTVSRFALDVNGEMREGVVVEKEKATQAFEAVTRRQIDPGIVEKTKGNNFKTRVYPIPAKGYKKAIIAFEEELTGKHEEFIYQLPIQIDNVLEDFSVKVEVVMNKPNPIKSKHPSVNLNFTEVRNAYISEYSEKDVKLQTQLAFAIPKPSKINQVLTYKGVVSADNYFYIHLQPKAEIKAKSKPSNIAIVWDESMSGKDRNQEKELNLLEKYLEWIQTGEIELITFSVTRHKQESYSIVDGKCNALIESLQATRFDGASNLGAIDFKSITVDEILLFSDGISNFGSEPQLHFSAPILAINSSNSADHDGLDYIASTSNGVYVNAFKYTEKEAFEIMVNQQKRFIRADYNQDNIKELYPKPGKIIYEHFSCAGKAEGALNEVVLHFGFGNTITESHTVSVDNTKRIENSVGERIWAQKKLNALMSLASDEEIKEHGKKYSLVTSGTSLIVLDEVADYVRYEIVPPASLLKEYNSMMSNQSKRAELLQQDRIQQICKRFEADIKWWENVSAQKPKKPKPDVTRSGEGEPDMDVVENNNITPEEPIVAEEDVEVLEEIVFAEGESIEEEAVMFYMTTSEINIEGGDERSKSEEKKVVLDSKLEIKKWESNASYMSDLKAVDIQDLYSTYLGLKKEHEMNPSFYFDVASYLFQKSQNEAGLRVVSNLAELELENAELLRTLGRKLSEHGFYKEALFVFQKVLQFRSFEPHSYIDLGMTYAEMKEYQKAIDNLYVVIEKVWDEDIINRFPGIELIVLHDMNNIIHHHKNQLDVSKINECFIKHLPVDIRIVIDWDANSTDIDLWITDPTDEKCSYKNKETRIGGKISNDITQGYGPEEFRLKKAPEGEYLIEADFYGSTKQTIMGNVTMRAWVYSYFGSENEHKEVLTLQLEPDKSGNYTIGKVEFKK